MTDTSCPVCKEGASIVDKKTNTTYCDLCGYFFSATEMITNDPFNRYYDRNVTPITIREPTIEKASNFYSHRVRWALKRRLIEVLFEQLEETKT